MLLVGCQEISVVGPCCNTLCLFAALFQVIPCPEPLKEEFDSIYDGDLESDSDGPNLIASRDGNSLKNVEFLASPVSSF